MSRQSSVGEDEAEPVASSQSGWGMGDTRFDAIVRQIGRSGPRRGVMRAVATGAMATFALWGSPFPPDVMARRNICQLRCGGDRRLCRNDCRHDYYGAAERQCKRGCNRIRDACHKVCEYRPLRSRLLRG
ncbi:MAG: hypothetical protein ACRDJC_12540 [Thermomicrobiales bacterium]